MKALDELLEKAQSFTPISKEYILRIYKANSEEFEEAWEKLLLDPENSEFVSLIPNGLWLQCEKYTEFDRPKEEFTLFARIYGNWFGKIACLKVMAKIH